METSDLEKQIMEILKCHEFRYDDANTEYHIREYKHPTSASDLKDFCDEYVAVVVRRDYITPAREETVYIYERPWNYRSILDEPIGTEKRIIPEEVISSDKLYAIHIPSEGIEWFGEVRHRIKLEDISLTRDNMNIRISLHPSDFYSNPNFWRYYEKVQEGIIQDCKEGGLRTDFDVTLYEPEDIGRLHAHWRLPKPTTPNIRV